MKIPTKLFFGMVLLCLALGSSAATPTSYTLVCKGGANMMVTNARTNVTILYRQASRAATVAQPGEGECAWLDRGWRSGEPIAIVMRHSAGDFIPVAVMADAKIWGGRVGGSEGSATVRQIAGVMNSVLQKQLFYLRGYSDHYEGSALRVFIVTRYGP